MRELLPVIAAWEAEGQGIARAVVIATYGSAPRREGAVLLRADDGRIAGSVSGGCVEGATAEALAETRATGLQRIVRFGVSDEQAWTVGLACGGTIDVLVQPAIAPVVLSAARAIAGTDTSGSASGGRAVVTTLPAGSPGPTEGGFVVGPAVAMTEPIVVTADGDMDGTLGDSESDAALVAAAKEALARGVSLIVELAGVRRFIEAFPPRPRLVIVGGVPIAMVLVRLARELGYETVVIDARAAFATPERFPEVDRLLVAWPEEAAEAIALGPADAVAVLSHDPKFDEPAVAEALRRGCRYVGAIGSRRTQEARRERLRAAGIPG